MKSNFLFFRNLLQKKKIAKLLYRSTAFFFKLFEAYTRTFHAFLTLILLFCSNKPFCIFFRSFYIYITLSKSLSSFDSTCSLLFFYNSGIIYLSTIFYNLDTIFISYFYSYSNNFLS